MTVVEAAPLAATSADPSVDASLPEGSRAAARDALVERVRAIAQGPLAREAERIDREGHYPRDILQALGRAGAYGAHLERHAGGQVSLVS